MFERRDFKTRSLSSGAIFSIPVFFFKGTDKNAPSVYIQSSVHGAELQGYMVALELIQYLAKQPPKGDVTIVPLANPYGVNSKIGDSTFGRFDPSTGENWNRHYENLCCLTAQEQENAQQLVVEQWIHQYPQLSFAALAVLFKEEMKKYLLEKINYPQPYAKKLNLQLQLLASQADIVLDLHCDTLSEPHIYSSSYALPSAVMLNFPYIIEIPNDFKGALDEATFSPWLHLLQAYNAQHNEKITKPAFEAFTIELGNQEQINQTDAKQQAENILFYLSRKGACHFKEIKTKESIFSSKLENLVTMYSPMGGMIIKTAPLGEEVSPHSPLVTINNIMLAPLEEVSEDFIKKTSHIMSYYESCIPITRICSVNVHEGMPMMKILTNIRKIKGGI